MIPRVLLQMGRKDEAIAEIEKAQAITPDKDSLDADVAYIYALSGQKDKTIQIVHRMRTRSRSRFVPPTNLARVYCSLGDKEEALHWLEIAFARQDTHLDALKIDPQWDPLRSDPRFQDLMKRVGL